MLSDRLRPGVEAAPWVIEEIKKLEKELAEAYAEMNEQWPYTRKLFNPAVWVRARRRRPQWQ